MLSVIFYTSAAISIISTIMVITRKHAVHALLFFVVSLLSVAMMFYLIGAPFVAALEVIIYAGAIMTLFIFVIMMLNLGVTAIKQEQMWLSPKIWVGPSILSFILFLEFLIVSLNGGLESRLAVTIDANEIGLSLFSKYLMGVELIGILLLAGIVGAYHIGKRPKKIIHRYLE